MEKLFYNVKEMCAVSGLSKATLCRYRMNKDPKGPPFKQLDGRILYPVELVKAWAETDITDTGNK